MQSCIARAEANLRMLLDIPDNYKVLFFQVTAHRMFPVSKLTPDMLFPDMMVCFVQGGAHAQFAAIPLNLFGKQRIGD